MLHLWPTSMVLNNVSTSIMVKRGDKEAEKNVYETTKSMDGCYLSMITLFRELAWIGGPSGSGKTSLAHKMANIVGCEVVSLENYYKSERGKDSKYDDFSSLDRSLLSKVWYLMLSTVTTIGVFIFVWLFCIQRRCPCILFSKCTHTLLVAAVLLAGCPSLYLPSSFVQAWD